MNDLQIFSNEKFGSVRTTTVNGEVMFVGKDVADILGYQNGSRDINRHVDEYDRKKRWYLMEIKIKRPSSGGC